jgi:hypothetical protein
MTTPTDSKVTPAATHAERLAAEEDGALTAELLARGASRKAHGGSVVERGRFEAVSASFVAEAAFRRNVVVATIRAEVMS